MRSAEERLTTRLAALKAAAQQKMRAIIAAITTIGVVGMAIGLGTPLLAALMSAQGVPESTIGWNGTIGGVATICAAAMASRIAVRFGVVLPILSMLIVGGLTFIGFYFFQNIYAWFILRFILHFAMTIMFVLSEFWVNSSAPPKHRAFVLALYAITLGVGFALGPLIFKFVGSAGFLPFGIGCGLIILALIPILMAWNLNPVFKDSAPVSFLPYIFAIPTSTMAVLVFGAIQMGAISLLVPFAKALNYSENQAGIFMTMLAIGYVVLLPLIGMLSDRLQDRRWALLACGVVGLIGTLSVPWIYSNQYLLMLLLFLLGGITAGLYTIGLAQLGARLKGAELAAANAAFIFCYGIGMLIGPVIMGYATQYIRPFGFSWSMSVFLGLYVVLVAFRLLGKSFRT